MDHDMIEFLLVVFFILFLAKSRQVDQLTQELKEKDRQRNWKEF